MGYKLTVSYRAKGKCSICGKVRQVTTYDLEEARRVKIEFNEGKYVCSDHVNESTKKQEVQ